MGREFIRSAENVSWRYLYDIRKSCGTPRNLGSLRERRKGAADRTAAHRGQFSGKEADTGGVHL